MWISSAGPYSFNSVLICILFFAIFLIIPPSKAVIENVLILFSLEYSIASIKFFEFPEAEIAIKRSPGLAKTFSWLTKTFSYPKSFEIAVQSLGYQLS